MTSSRVPPNSPDAERSLLGAILLQGSVLQDVLPMVKPEDFYETRHRKIFEACCKLHRRATSVDAVLIAEALKRRGALDKLGGEAYLAQLVAMVPSAAGATDYAQIVREKADRRIALRASEALTTAMLDGAEVTLAVEAARRRLEQIAVPRHQNSPALLQWRPFPVKMLPEPCRGFVTVTARALGCDLAYVAVPLLAVLAGCIGNKRRIRLKRSWVEPCVIWSVIVGLSGTLKSPAVDAATAYLKRREMRAFRAYEKCLSKYKTELREYNKDRLGERPKKPVPPRFVVSDVTVEALAVVLKDNPRGLLLARDELGAWLAGRDRYREKKGGDAQQWLEIHRAGDIIVDRKTEPKTICVPKAAVSVTGGIQPDTLRAVLGREDFHNGTAARILLAMPPPLRKRWTEQTVPEETQEAMEDVLKALLLDLEFDSRAREPNSPCIVGLSPEAKRQWVAFYDRHADRIEATADADLAAAFSKLEGYAARIALVFHQVRVVAGEAIDAEAVDPASMRGGIALAEWFVHETERVYQRLRETEPERQRRELVELVRTRDGRITARQLMRASRKYRDSSEVAGRVLNGLVQDGLGRWEERRPGPKGGRPTCEFVLAGDGDATEPDVIPPGCADIARNGGEVPSPDVGDGRVSSDYEQLPLFDQGCPAMEPEELRRL